ncbi:MAG TPA: OB-fold domain-containing protein [Acidobacteriota bacterium]|nr:OB-fold domain-containing protein [Acidobacteriota bacterium]
MDITIRRCPSCSGTYLNDVDLCPRCSQVVQTVQEQVPGTGKVYSYTRVHVSPEQFKHIVPYYLAIVQLEAGPRLMARLKTEDGDNVRIDAPVELVGVENGYIFALK